MIILSRFLLVKPLRKETLFALCAIVNLFCLLRALHPLMIFDPLSFLELNKRRYFLHIVKKQVSV